ncbi:YacL family protein [Vibrio porteresiae]|uniref:YacL family protein n=1 Tax=Vibrio porteresiae DSM 19223 TaxID=1123496 RepID=A0ABZ0QCE2_9VIBR|nr:YacL family protein [Vibrio porteresiae]WPC73656.1 YacL family protein [Vibrio porteresiae DSM 19223]
MDFEFTKNTLLGEYYVKCSMEHQIVGRWLQEEIGRDCTKIDQILALIEKAHQFSAQELQWQGKEISVLLTGQEVTVEENARLSGIEEEFEDDFSLYESESYAQCGLEDFESLLLQWRDFTR